MRIAMTAWIALALVLVALSVGRVSHKDGTVAATVQVTSANRQASFSLGDQATMMVKPGSDLERFLSRQRGRKVTVLLTEESAR